MPNKSIHSKLDTMYRFSRFQRTCPNLKSSQSRSKQRTGQRVLVHTLKFLALKKNWFSPVKNNSPPKKKYFFTFFLCNFSVRTLQCFQKKILFDHKKLKTPPKKVAHNRPRPFFFLCSPACPKQPRSSFPFYKFSYTFICVKICVHSKAKDNRVAQSQQFCLLNSTKRL